MREFYVSSVMRSQTGAAQFLAPSYHELTCQMDYSPVQLGELQVPQLLSRIG